MPLSKTVTCYFQQINYISSNTHSNKLTTATNPTKHLCILVPATLWYLICTIVLQ